MSDIKKYIESSLLIPPEIKESMMRGEMHSWLEGEMLHFIERYGPLEQAILREVNTELEILNGQIKNYILSQESQIKKEELGKMEMEIAYL